MIETTKKQVNPNEMGYISSFFNTTNTKEIEDDKEELVRVDTDFSFWNPPDINEICLQSNEKPINIEEIAKENSSNYWEEELIDTKSKKEPIVNPNIFFKIQRTENLNENSIRWEIWLDGEGYTDDDLTVWEGCLSAVHQSCYGRDLAQSVPYGDWFWERWTYLKSNNMITQNDIDKVKWNLCFDWKGIIVYTEPFEWVHPICVNWINEIYFDEDSNLTKIVGVVEKERFNIRWRLCKRQKGACIQCDYKNCTFNFHVSWGVSAGLIKIWSEMNEMKDPEDPNSILIFCNKHQIKGKNEAKNRGFKSVKDNFNSKNDRKRKTTEITSKNKNDYQSIKKRKIYNNEEDKEEEYTEDFGVDLCRISKPKPKVEKIKNNSKKIVKKNWKNKTKKLTPLLENELNKLVSNMRNLEFSKIDDEKEIIARPQNQKIIKSIQNLNNKESKCIKFNQPFDSNSNKLNIATNAIFIVDPRLARIIQIKKGTRKEILDKFIKYAVKNDLVDMKTHNYLIFKDYELKTIFSIDIITSSELSLQLLPMLKEEKTFSAKSDMDNNFESIEQNWQESNEESRNSKLLKKIRLNINDDDKPDIFQSQKNKNDYDVDNSEDSEGGLTLNIKKSPCSTPDNIDEFQSNRNQINSSSDSYHTPLKIKTLATPLPTTNLKSQLATNLNQHILPNKEGQNIPSINNETAWSSTKMNPILTNAIPNISPPLMVNPLMHASSSNPQTDPTSAANPQPSNEQFITLFNTLSKDQLCKLLSQLIQR